MSIAVPVGGSIVLTQMAQGIDRDSAELPWQDGATVVPGHGEQLGHLFLGGFGVMWRYLMGVSAFGGLSSLLVR